jgi:hypothetical protein
MGNMGTGNIKVINNSAGKIGISEFNQSLDNIVKYCCSGNKIVVNINQFYIITSTAKFYVNNSMTEITSCGVNIKLCKNKCCVYVTDCPRSYASINNNLNEFITVYNSKLNLTSINPKQAIILEDVNVLHFLNNFMSDYLTAPDGIYDIGYNRLVDIKTKENSGELGLWYSTTIYVYYK